LSRPVRRLGLLAIAAAIAAAVAACAGGSEPSDRATGPDHPRTPAPSATTVPATTVPPDFHPAPRPLNLPDESVAWYHHAAPGGSEVLFGIVRGNRDPSSPAPTIVLVPGSDGFSADYVTFGKELASRGFDVGFGCWWANLPIPEDDATSVRILCPDAPAFKGVVDAAVPDVDALVEGIRHALGEPAEVAVFGFSRGGGIVALRASAGRPEPVIVVAGLVEGWNNLGTVPGGEVDVLDRVDGIRVPVLLLHGVDDVAVPVIQAQHLEAALRSRGIDVEAHYYPDVGHGLVTVPDVRSDMWDRVTAFLCARLTCPSNP
jgi:alpha-beta hydrolase superfamily lysophospholipase